MNHCSKIPSKVNVFKTCCYPLVFIVLLFVSLLAFSGCAANPESQNESAGGESSESFELNDKGVDSTDGSSDDHASSAPDPEELRAQLSITEDYRDSFVHGEKRV